MCQKDRKDEFWELLRLISQSDVKLFDLPTEDIEIQGPRFRDIVLEDATEEGVNDNVEESLPFVNCGEELLNLVEFLYLNTLVTRKASELQVKYFMVSAPIQKQNL